MPRSPDSPSMCTRELMSTNSVDAVASGSFWKVRTTPPCSTTNHLEASFGAWSIAVGDENDRFANARGVSRPVWQGGGGGGGGGGGVGVGMFPPPPQPTIPRDAAASTRLRRFMWCFLVKLPCQDCSNGAKFRRRSLQRPVHFSKTEPDEPCLNTLVAERRQGYRRLNSSSDRDS